MRDGNGWILRGLPAALLSVTASFGATLISDDFGDRKTSAWRYADSQGRWGQPDVRDVVAAGVPTPAAAIDTDVRGATLIFLAYHYQCLDVTEDLRLRVRYTFRGAAAESARLLLTLTSLPKGESDPKGGGKARGQRAVEPTQEADGWCTVDLPVTTLGVPPGHRLYRVSLCADAPQAEGATQLLVRDIALHDGPGPPTGEITPPADGGRTGLITGEKIRAVHPKTLWNSDPTCSFSEEALRWLHSLGFTVVGPARGGEAACRVLAERARSIGLQVYGSRALCYEVPNDAAWEDEQMVWFNGWRQAIACPAGADFWRGALEEPLVVYARVSRDLPVVAVLLDWEIYARPKFRNQYGPCYCDACVSRYRSATGSEIPSLSAADRYTWLRAHSEAGTYDHAFYSRIEELARGLRAALDAENPKLSIFLIPWSSPFLEAVARGVATDEAPVWVSNESTYGKASPSIPDDAAIEANVATCLDDRRRLDDLGIPYRYLAATYNGWGSPEFHGRALVRMAEVAHGYWFFEDVGWYREQEDPIDRDELYRCYAHANAEIRFGTYEDPWRWGVTPADSAAPRVPPGKVGVGLSGDSGGRLAGLLDPERFLTYPAPLIEPSALGSTKVLVLQNFNARLAPGNPVVATLRRFVENGGGLFLGHDTGFFMASPFPNVVSGPLDPPEKGDPRHILDLQIRIGSGQGVPPAVADRTYDTSFNDHLTFELGPEATVLARDRYDHPVIVGATVGKGRVVYSGCWYGRLTDTGSVEARLTRALLEWLAPTAE